MFDKTQNFAMLPNAIFSTWQGTQNPDTMPTLPRAKNAYTQPTPHQLTNNYQQFVENFST